MRKIGIGMATIAIIAGILLLGWYFKEDSEEKSKAQKQHAMMEKELNPLSVRKREVERQLRELEEHKEETIQAKGTTVLLFTDMDKQIYKKAYPIMQEFGFKGVLLISKELYPGAEGCMTKEQFDEMIADGWTYCVKWSESEDVSAWQKEQEQLLASLNLELTDTVYFPEGTYKEEYKAGLKKMGYCSIAHCGDENIPLIPKEVSGAIWFPGSYGMSDAGPRNYLNDAMEQGSSIVYRIGFTQEEELFDKATFESMLNWMESYEEKEMLQVMDFSGAYQYHKNLTAKRNKTEESVSDEETALRNEIDSIEQQIDAIYKKYLNTQEDEEWNEIGSQI